MPILHCAVLVVAGCLAQPPQKGDGGTMERTTEGAKKGEADYRALNAAMNWVWLTDAASCKDRWKGYRKEAFPASGWAFDTATGVLASSAGGGGGDLMTREQYGDFELAFQFKCAPKANSGVIYRSTEKHGASWMTGPEFQVIDDAGNSLKPDDPHSSGALYDILKPPADKVFKAGDWNEGRIYVRSGLVQHWLNGKKVAEVQAFNADGKPSQAWTKAIAASKFKEYEGFGVQPKGSIVLQDHGDEVSYRDVSVRALDVPGPNERLLFNGKDLTGWTAVVPELADKKEDQTKPWSVKDGVLRCEGKPGGYIRTTEKFTNFVFRCQWRFDPARGPGNSGVLLRTNGEDKVWPRSIEAQLESGNAGDFWNIDQMKMTVAKERTSGRNTKKTHGAERAL
ncbi:MAG: DUF1080 domain-containing protein, partial [Phycisphaerales bacterium]|nr:DUF1080 domain-containing protein [Phycisphaerales bacterium]